MFLIKYIFVSVIIFLISFFGLIYNKKSILIILIAIELVLLSVNILFIVFSIYLDDIIGQIFTLFILTIAAVETSIGLSLLLVSYRVRGNILIDNFNLLYF
jgi:NADH-quinone oxidoreductase subunit K|uniref:NADH dehydrogenase subunit 4L n=1 Tax=Blastocystis sp. DMP/02-328 TaxID=463136 RepID=B5SQ70_9STRA|nr:NADH dehydrogenase subunit 4L [Blastocystis sp. DMP/02-328]YP_009166953.1 NADH dehydrogenase subunit 4L [Blastocystis sp. subtype 4]ACH86061.1 NADH dehydrogenase subunit 4L [Blastocystis sp. DMP/02-328]ALC78905.1 NADH dehydrogenase subunit 4L [Blastocystis sp. subtype 4]